MTDKPSVKKKEKQDIGPMLRALKAAKPIYGALILAAFLCLLLVAGAILQPKLLGKAVQYLYDYWAGDFTGESLKAELLPVLGVLLAVYLLRSALDYAKMYVLNTNVSRYFTCAMRIRMADKISRLPVSFIDKTPPGEIIDRMTEDISILGNSLHQLVDTLMMGFLQIFAIAGTMLFTDWRLALLVIALMPFSILISTKVSAKSERHFDSMFAESGKLYAVVEESYTNYMTTKAYNYEEATMEAHGTVNTRLRKAETMATFLAGITRPVIVFTNALSYILISLVSGLLVVRYGISVGTVVTIILFAKQFSAPMETIAEGLATLRRTNAAAKRVFRFLDEAEADPGEGSFTAEIRGDVSFRNVDFAYDPKVPLIRDFSVDLKAGQKVAIVGPTGAGKTTVVNLLMRFYNLDKGKITVDGRDIASVSRDEARKLFGMVLQDTWLFKGTVAENVAYGKPDATREEIVRACDEAYCDHFIRTLPQGYDTVISEDSSNISGGQKQLLTIARALLSDRKLLILDEATSNVDTRTEILLQKAMDRLMQGRTSFVIAHRLSTIVDADIILVVRDGRIVETGRHGELLEKKGFYYEMYNSQ